MKLPCRLPILATLVSSSHGRLKVVKVFRLWAPKQIARYVKTFYRGSFMVAEMGLFSFDNGLVSYEEMLDPQQRQSAATINRFVRDLTGYRP